MNGYLVAEEGPLAGLTVVFEESTDDKEWSLGRDPEVCDVILEDPMVSRQHATVRATPEGFIFENLSSVNPATQNGMVIAEPVLLREGDTIQIGSTFFNFTEKEPENEPTPPKRVDQPQAEGALDDEGSLASEIHFGPTPDTRWLLKVISGPNAGAEFAMEKGSTYLIGKDPNICDIVFQDLSVSRQHARLSIDGEENASIEDLGSRNGVIVNGELISEKQLLSSQDMVALGTTTFLVVDRQEARDTIISPPAMMPKVPNKTNEEQKAREKRDWKETVIPKRHLVMAAVLAGVLFVSFFGMVSLFRSETVVVKKADHGKKIEEALAKFPGVHHSYNDPSGKLFLTGHVMTTVDHQELLYTIKELPFVEKYEDNIVVDELVWQNMNALLSRNSDWVGVSVYGPGPGRFVLRGYVETLDEAENLVDYINLNFDYLDKLQNQVVIEKNLEDELQSQLIERGYSGVTFQLSNGEVVFTGMIDEKQERAFNGLLTDFREIPGIRLVKNFVVTSRGDISRKDISKDFQVTGFSKRDDKEFYVVIGGKILGRGDMLDGMLITKIHPKLLLLEKDGVKYRINYNFE